MVECEYIIIGGLDSGTIGFNRYMVECESTFLLISLILYRGFNRYMVECELITYPSFSILYTVLIDTWWNVNLMKSAVITLYLVF